MAKKDSTSSAASTENGQKNVSSVDIEAARIILKANCDALSAIANAVEVLASLNPKPEKLFSHTIARLMSHAVYLSDSTGNEVGCFIDDVEEAAEVSHV